MGKVKFKEFLKLKNYYYYLQGTLRYKIYYKYKFLKFLVPNYIWKQIEVRINSIDKECYNQGYCKMCGCSVTALQFANKACDKPCYPKMLSERHFNSLLGKHKPNKPKTASIIKQGNYCWYIDINSTFKSKKLYEYGRTNKNTDKREKPAIGFCKRIAQLFRK